MWDGFVELIRATIFAVAHACGGSIGGSVALVTFVLRLALIPLSLRMMRRAQAMQERLAALKPQLDRLQRRYGKDPRRLAAEQLAVYRKNGLRMIDPMMWLSWGIQAPLFGGLYAAVRAGLGAGRRFLWIADLGRPDGWIALAAAGLVGASVLFAPAGSAGGGAMAIRVSAMLAVATTLVFMINAPAATVVSVAAGALGGVVQGWMGKRIGTPRGGVPR